MLNPLIGATQHNRLNRRVNIRQTPASNATWNLELTPLLVACPRLCCLTRVQEWLRIAQISMAPPHYQDIVLFII